MLELSRGYVAYLLAGYGEPEVSAAIVKSSDAEFRWVQEAANQGAVEGKEWLKVACRTAIEIVEGRPRELRRRQLVPSDMPQELMVEDNKAYAKRAERDHFERRRDWLEADLAFFEERFQDYAEKNREELRSEYRKTVEGWEKRN